MYRQFFFAGEYEPDYDIRNLAKWMKAALAPQLDAVRVEVENYSSNRFNGFIYLKDKRRIEVSFLKKHLITGDSVAWKFTIIELYSRLLRQGGFHIHNYI